MESDKSRTFQPSATSVSILAHLLAIAVTTLVLLWLIHIREGLAFRSHNKFKIFNVHPLSMIIGFILSGEAIMAHKTVPGETRAQKTVHGMLHLTALVAGGIGLYAVFKFHHEKDIPNFYTLHSWLGIITFSLYALQWLVAFWSFVFPRAEMKKRTSYLPWHTYFGLIIFLLSICTAEMGLLQKFHFLKLVRNREALIVNFTGLLILLFGIAVGVVASLSSSRKKLAN